MIKVQEVSTTGCAHCAQARKILHDEIKNEFPKVSVEFIDMLSDEGMRLVQKYAIMASPAIIINGKLFSVGALDKNKLVAELRKLEGK